MRRVWAGIEDSHRDHRLQDQVSGCGPALFRFAARHPGVADVLVRGADDEEWGQVVEALVVPTDTDRPPNLDELRAFVKETEPPHLAPRRLLLVESVPRTSLGKLRRG